MPFLLSGTTSPNRPMHWLEQRLQRKFIVATTTGLLVSSLVFLALFVTLYRGQLERDRSDAAAQVNRLLQTSLENAMLKRDLDGLRTIVRRLGDQSGILAVRIANPPGEVRFASRPELLGEQLHPASQLPSRSGTRFTLTADGREVLRSINPVYNKAPCQECHGPVEKNPVNGVLYVDYDAAPLRAKARSTTFFLMGSGALIVLINLAGGWWFIRRFILVPVNRLGAASKRLALGDLDARVDLKGGDELCVLGDTFNDMAQRLQDQLREVQEKEQFLQQLVDAIPDGVRIIDEDYRVLLANRTCQEQLGHRPGEGPTFCYEQAHGRDTPCPETLIQCPLQEIKRHVEPLKVVHRHSRSDGTDTTVEIYSAPMRITRHGVPRLLVVESIRDLEQQARFSHEQKLSELGRLAAGVAHEIHNPLASVRLALHAAQTANQAEKPAREQVREYLDLVDQEVDKCIKVTERLLKLSVPPPSQAELVDIDRILDDTLKLLQWDAENQSVSIGLRSETPCRILATDSELRMITLNLAQNALHAMPRGGRLQVDCVRDNGTVRIVFQDDGIGIPPDELPKIFEPFFSRRADGVRGTGLGLSITKTIVKNHGGTLEVSSVEGEGSRFVVRFPDADAATGE